MTRQLVSIELDFHLQDRQVLTDDKHGARGGLQSHGADRNDCPSPIDWILEHVDEANAATELPLSFYCGAYVVRFGLDVSTIWP